MTEIIETENIKKESHKKEQTVCEKCSGKLSPKGLHFDNAQLQIKYICTKCEHKQSKFI